MVGFIPQINHHWQFFLLHLGCDLLQHFGAGDLIGQGRNHYFAVLDEIDGAGFQRASSGPIQLYNFLFLRDELSFGGEVRSLDIFAQVFHRRFRLVQQVNTCARHLSEIMRGYIRRHADCYATAAIQQYVGQPGWKNLRFIEGPIKIRLPVDRAQPQFAQEHIDIGSQSRFRVTHRGKGFWIVLRPPVALAVY